MLNISRIIRLLSAGLALRTFVQYLIAFCSQPKAGSDVISGWFVSLIIPDKPIKFRGPRLNRSQEIPPKPYEK